MTGAPLPIDHPLCERLRVLIEELDAAGQGMACAHAAFALSALIGEKWTSAETRVGIAERVD